MNKFELCESLEGVYQRLGCQRFVPIKEIRALIESTDKFIENGGLLDGEILQKFRLVLNQIVADIIYLRNDGDKQHFSEMHEMVASCMARLPIPSSEERI